MNIRRSPRTLCIKTACNIQKGRALLQLGISDKLYYILYYILFMKLSKNLLYYKETHTMTRLKTIKKHIDKMVSQMRLQTMDINGKNNVQSEM